MAFRTVTIKKCGGRGWFGLDLHRFGIRRKRQQEGQNPVGGGIDLGHGVQKKAISLNGGRLFTKEKWFSSRQVSRSTL